jgi:23S rRNA pseudouridine1911/1915/1917 synthase
LTRDAEDIVFRVGDDEAGERIDKVVAARLSGAGRRKVAELFRNGSVQVAGRMARKGQTARAEDEVRVRLSPPILPEPELELGVRLETASVVVVEKPAGQPTAPAADGDRGTLAAALLGRYPEMAGVGYRAREPGLLHRLDTETSGLVVAARSGAAFDALRGGLEAGRFQKRYLAVVPARGMPDAGTIDAPLEPDPSHGRLVRVAPEGSDRTRRATHFRKLRTLGEWALVELDVSRAYRHQVRVHLASIGHPIAGDALYGGPEAPLGGARHALHASYVAWTGDDVVPGFAVESALPEDLSALVFPR